MTPFGVRSRVPIDHVRRSAETDVSIPSNTSRASYTRPSRSAASAASTASRTRSENSPGRPGLSPAGIREPSPPTSKTHLFSSESRRLPSAPDGFKSSRPDSFLCKSTGLNCYLSMAK